MGAVLSACALTKRFGQTVAVDDLTFEVARGRVTGFLGPNGAGKTTTLKIALGLVEPTSGDARIFGSRFKEIDEPARHVGAVLEPGDAHPRRSGRDHLRVLAAAADLPVDRIDHVLALVDLGHAARERVGRYSLGMKQRLGLAVALLGDPELLVLDEPGNGLDPKGVRWLREFMRRFADNGGTVLISSHHLAEVAQTVDDVVIIDRGRLVTAAPLAELVADAETLEEVFLGLTAKATV